VCNVVVTGGSRGLGLGIARRLAQSGHRVIAIARQESDQLASAILEVRQGESGSLTFRPCDLSDVGAIPGFIKQLRRDFGPIYGLVNNAAAGASSNLALAGDLQIERLVRLNVLSPLIVTKYVLRTMMADGIGGRIVNIASIVSFSGFSGLSVYGATKAALVGFTRSLAREVGPLGINVNAIAPGFVDTDMTHGLGSEQRDQVIRRSALRRLANIDDVAEAVEFLLSSRTKNITGTVLTVDAGSTA
jgi:3-oxoacyl-[acyl-carrier protein] reductase